MIEIYSKALNKHLEIDRIIGKIESENKGPCLVFFCGIHGNEPSGIFALQQVFQELKKQSIPVNGSIYALAGNLWALERSERFHKQDLNRLWSGERLQRLESGTFIAENEDEKQQEELFKIIRNIFSGNEGPYYFFDLHTTSSKTTPFLTVNDSLLNRKFTQQYPVPTILGIEEYLDGPLLSYINELGYVSFGFEGGRHDDRESIDNHIAFAYLSLVFTGAIEKENISFSEYFLSLSNTKGDIYEIYHRHEVLKNQLFKMQSGYINFQSIKKGQHLADINGEPILAKNHSRIFMPLYQDKGDDGFFLIRRVSPVFLKLSALMRKRKLDRLLSLLPGISRSSAEEDSLIVNLKVAKLLAKQFLHLLGYRNKKVDKKHLIIRSREINSREKDYQEEHWYKKAVNNS